jgi:hypothetical protein
MKGVWTWPSEPKEQDKVLLRISTEDELSTILLALANSPEGLSNAKLDRLLANNSQWRTLPHMRELVALGFVKYEVQFFGESGRYQLTALGMTVLQRLQAKQ